MSTSNRNRNANDETGTNMKALLLSEYKKLDVVDMPTPADRR